MKEVGKLATELGRNVRDVCQFKLEQTGERISPEQSKHFLAGLLCCECLYIYNITHMHTLQGRCPRANYTTERPPLAGEVSDSVYG
jgi:hypothetical protein